MRFTLGDNATARPLVERATGRELCASQAKLPVATVLVSGEEHRAVSATRAGEQLQLRFAGVDTPHLRCERRTGLDLAFD